MQKTLLIGYLGKDPEMKYIPSGTAIATFTIASTERWKNSAGEPLEIAWHSARPPAEESLVNLAPCSWITPV